MLSDFRHHWYFDVSIPIVAAIIGYVTKLVAIRLMFRPLEFVDVKPYLDWQALIRTAFEQDEWILITVGGVVGFAMGEVQVLVLEHFASR